MIFTKVQENSMNDEHEFPFSLDYPVAGMLQMGRDGPAEFSEELLVEGFVGLGVSWLPSVLGRITHCHFQCVVMK